MNIDINNFLTRTLLNCIQHYNHKKYWKLRDKVIDPNSTTPKIVRLYYLLYLKKIDAFHNASMGTDLGAGAIFASSPFLPHGLNGIIISYLAKIGHNCTICQQVSIIQEAKAATIGDNCMIGAGTKIIGEVYIGNNVNIGANSVVTKDVPDNCTVVGAPATIVRRNGIRISNI